MSGLEAATYISDLVTSNPAASDPKAQGDDHIRLIKSTAQASFPNASRAFYIPTSVAAQTSAPTVAAASQGKIYPINATSSSITVALPAGSGLPDGYEVTIFKSDSTANTVVIDPNSSETINGALTFSLTKQFQGMRCIWLATYAAWIGEHWIAAIPYFSGGQDIAFTDIAPSANAKRILAATTATDWSEHTITAILEFVSASLARGDLLMRGASAFDRFAPGTAGYVLTSGGAAADLAWASKQSLQPGRAYAELGTVQNCTTVIPFDNTIPTDTEGDAVLTATLAPTFSTSRIRVTAVVQARSTVAARGAVTLCRSGSSAAVAVASITNFDSTLLDSVPLQYEYAPGSTASVTWTVRVGPGQTGSVGVNSGASGQVYGGVSNTSMVVQEIFIP